MNFDVTIEKPEIQHFFEVYKELEPGKVVDAARWVARPTRWPRSRTAASASQTPKADIPENHPSVALRGASRVLVIYGRH